MMIKDEENNYRVRSSAGGQDWKSLQAIHLIGVGPFLGTINTGSSPRNLTAKNWLKDNSSLREEVSELSFLKYQRMIRKV